MDYSPTPPERLLERYQVLRTAMLEWLSRNDRNGEYSDPLADEDARSCLTVDDAACMIREALATGSIAGQHNRFRPHLCSHVIRKDLGARPGQFGDGDGS